MLHFSHDDLIDNSDNIYIPLRLKCGIKLRCRIEVLSIYPKVLKDLQKDVGECFKVLPPSVHNLLRRTQIWVNYSYCYGPRHNPKRVIHTTAHHGEGWLICMRDNPEKALGIEIYDCMEYQKLRLHWNGCGLILHEFCHLIHQIALPGGLNNYLVLQAYQNAIQSTKYCNVFRRDWAGLPDEMDQAYATINHKEFFAEMSVAFLCKGYKDLDHIRGPIEKCSPMFMDQTVLERYKDNNNESGNRLSSPHYNNTGPKSNNILEFLSSLLPSNAHPHCNKFYPFTRGQIESYDPKLAADLCTIWSIIESWTDLDDTSCKLLRFVNCGSKSDSKPKHNVFLPTDDSRIQKKNAQTASDHNMYSDTVDL